MESNLRPFFVHKFLNTSRCSGIQTPDRETWISQASLQTPPVPARLLTIVIISFWFVMTGMLMKSIWFPADSLLAEVQPGAVFQLIAARGEASVLDIYDDRKIVGHLNIQTNRFRHSQRHTIKVRMNGKVSLTHPLLAGTSLEIMSWVDFDHAGEILAFDAQFSTGRNALVLKMSQTNRAAAPEIVLTNNLKVIFDSKTFPTDKLESNPVISLLLATVGITPTELEAMRKQAETQASEFEIVAREGSFDLNGNERQGYILKMGLPGRPGFRLCVENTGEIVRLETPTTFQLITETIRPLDAPVAAP
ncbi:MAG: hypothetical protein JWL81_2370 [Verrucomicrobiales bacterium]|nr:hypothetical protein [Verrucomicrobiales bacterium]